MTDSASALPPADPDLSQSPRTASGAAVSASSDSIVIGTTELYSNQFNLNLRPTIGNRGELRLMPNDSMAFKDPSSGAELTLLAGDSQVVGDSNNSALVLYSRRTAGVTQAFTIRSIAFGSAVQYPIELDSTGGIISVVFDTDGKQRNKFPVVIEPGYFPDGQITLTLADQGPSIRLQDVSAGGRPWRVRNIGSNFQVLDEQAVAVRLEIRPDGAVRAPIGVRDATYLHTVPKAFSALPSAVDLGPGARAFCSDSSLPAAGNFGAAVSGGGTNAVPVYSDGQAWRIG
jgi:hypothetical protein